jgi:hypothetical protein
MAIKSEMGKFLKKGIASIDTCCFEEDIKIIYDFSKSYLLN